MKISCMCTFKMSRCFYHTKFGKRPTIVKKVVFGRKLGYQGVILAVCPPGCLLYVTDCSTNCRFLVDRDLAFSIMPCQSVEPSSSPSLSGADSHPIPCWSKWPFTFTIDGVPHLWSFLLAALSFPILGTNFMQNHSLLVDVANLRLLSGPSPVLDVTASAPAWGGSLLKHQGCTVTPASILSAFSGPHWPPLLLHLLVAGQQIYSCSFHCFSAMTCCLGSPP
jgi:hypothetical protein